MIKEENFIHDEKYYLIYCPICKQENYVLAVATGICCWCGFNGNKGDNNGKKI